MASIEKKLKTWLEESLISAEQADAIRHYEHITAGQNSSNWWLYSLLILGASIIGLGIISLIAANWAEISDGVKLASAFMLLCGLGLAIFWQYSRPYRYWLDALISAFIILCLAVIGLITQIYHLHGYWYHALLFWSLITLPLIFFAHHLFVYFFWVTLFLHGAVWSGVAFSAGDPGYAYAKLPALFMFAPLLAASLYSLTYLAKFMGNFRSSFYFWFQVSALVALVFIDITRSGGEVREYELAWFLPGYLAAAVLAGVILSRPDYHWVNRGLLVAVIVLFLLYYHPLILFDGNTRYTYAAMQDSQGVSFWSADDIRAPFMTILILFLYATHAGNIGHHRTFNLVTFLIGLRFVVLYFQAMGGLAATGVGLIMSGLMIIGIAWFWYKSRGRLRRWTEALDE